MPRFLAIDADADGVFVATANVRGEHFTLDQVLAWSDGDGAPLSPANATFLGHKLKELLKQSGVKPAPVLLAIGRDRVILKEITHPPVAPTEEPALVRFQAERDLTESPDDVVMDYAPATSPDPENRRVTAFFTRKQILQAARVMCEAAGLKLAGVTPRPFASIAAIHRAVHNGSAPPPEHPAAAIATVVLWPNGGEFTVSRGLELLFARSIPATALNDDHSLIQTIRRDLAVFDGQNPSTPVEALYLAEPEEPGVGIARRVQAGVLVPVYPFDPLAGSAGGERVPPVLRGRFLGPVGLLALRGAASTLPINFATPRQPRAESGTGRPRLLLAGLFALLVFGMVLTFGILGLMQANDRLKQLAADKMEIEGDLTRLQPNVKRLEAAEEFENREVVTLDELYDLTDRFSDVSKSSVTEIDLQSLPPPKPKARRALPKASPNSNAPATAVAARPLIAAKQTKEEYPVAKLRVVLRGSNDQQAQHVADGFKNDKFYLNPRKEVLGQASGNQGQQYTITAEVLHRDPKDYARKLELKPLAPASAPTKPGTPASPKPTPAPKTQEAPKSGEPAEDPFADFGF